MKAAECVETAECVKTAECVEAVPHTWQVVLRGNYSGDV